MKRELTKKARELATQPYTTELFKDETTDGREIYLASHPELFGCMAQGETIEEAQDNLKDATVEYITSLLEDGLPIPQPKAIEITTAGPDNFVYEWDFKGSNFIDDLCGVVQPANRQSLGSFTSIPA